MILCVLGTVRLFDLRTKGGDDEDNVVVTMHGRRGEDRVAVNSIAMCPLGSYKFALGCADPFVRLYDLRATSGKAKFPTNVKMVLTNFLSIYLLLVGPSTASSWRKEDKYLCISKFCPESVLEEHSKQHMFYSSI